MRLPFLWCVGLIFGLAPPIYDSSAAAPKNPAVTENFYGVQIVGEKAWIVGYYGTILYSADRGLTWEIQNSPVRSALFSVRFVDPAKGWVSGSHGALLHTVDGGKNWRIQSTDTTDHLFGSFWLGETHGWIVGSRGATLRTDDAGRSWHEFTVPGDFTFSSVSFANQTRGWIAGEFGVIFQTRDGGKSWQKQKSPVEVSIASGESRNLFALQFTAPEKGWAFGLDGLILQTRDGNRWEIVRQRTDANSAAGGANHLFAAAASNNRLWAVGERGTLLKSDLDGNVWRQANSAIPRLSLNAIAFGNDGIGLAVGNRGIILRTEDHGATWKRLKLTGQSGAKDSTRAP